MKKVIILAIAIVAVLVLVGCKGKKETGGTCEIGQKGPGGGIIFFAENGSYMECSAEDIGVYNCNWDEAITVAQNYKGGGFSDWRLPTIEELNLMYENLKVNNLGGFRVDDNETGIMYRWYWSSSQDKDGTWVQYFENGNQYGHPGHLKGSVRAVRGVAATQTER